MKIIDAHVHLVQCIAGTGLRSWGCGRRALLQKDAVHYMKYAVCYISCKKRQKMLYF